MSLPKITIKRLAGLSFRLATPAFLQVFPVCLPGLKTFVAVEERLSRGCSHLRASHVRRLAAEVLLSPAPVLFEVLHLVCTVEPLAADREVIAAVVLLLLGPGFKRGAFGVALKCLRLPRAELLLMVTAPLLVFRGPVCLMWVKSISTAVEADTTDLFVVAAPRLFLLRPQLLAMTLQVVAVEAITGLIEMSAAIVLLVFGPQLLPAPSMQLTGVGRQSGLHFAATQMSFAAPGLLFLCPLALPVSEICRTIEMMGGSRTCTAFLLLDAAVGPLGIAPVIVHLVRHVVTIIAAATLLVVRAAPALLFGGPELMSFTCAVILLAANPLIGAAPIFPLVLPTSPVVTFGALEFAAFLILLTAPALFRAAPR